MAKSESIALRADPTDPEDFDVSTDGVAAAQAARAARRAKVGRPVGSNKEQIALRVDRDTLERFRAAGSGWQTRMNEALRADQPPFSVGVAARAQGAGAVFMSIAG